MTMKQETIGSKKDWKWWQPVAGTTIVGNDQIPHFIKINQKKILFNSIQQTH
jgi:hypothetical protein